MREIVITVISVLLIAGVIDYMNGKVDKERESARYALLITDSIQASADESKELVGLLEDSINVFHRRVVQTESQMDSIDTLLRQTTLAKAALEFRIASMSTIAEGISEETDNIRYAYFNTYEPPITVVAEITVPPIPQTPTGVFTVSIDPVPIQVRLSCREGPGGIINSAHILLETPSWLQTEIRQVNQSPNICNPPRVSETRVNWWYVAGAFALGAIILR